MASKVVAALSLLAITLAGAGILYGLYSAGLRALRQPARPVLSYVFAYNSTHGIYYVIDGCVTGTGMLVYANGSWVPGDRACRGSLIVLPTEEAVRVASVQGG